MTQDVIPTEDWEQRQFVAWLEERGYMFTAIPNSTYTPSIRAKVRNKQLGLRPGLPDLFIIAEHKAMFVEMKRVRNSYPTADQVEWIYALSMAGIPAAVCKGHQAAIEFVEAQL